RPEDWPHRMPPPPGYGERPPPPPPRYGELPPPPPRPGPGGPGGRPRLLVAYEPLEANALPPPAPRRGRGGRGGRPRRGVAYEPLEANALRQSATGSLAVALVTVLALLVATIVLWRLARRGEGLHVG